MSLCISAVLASSCLYVSLSPKSLCHTQAVAVSSVDRQSFSFLLALNCLDVYLASNTKDWLFCSASELVIFTCVLCTKCEGRGGGCLQRSNGMRLGWPCCLLAVNAPSALLCMLRFPEPIGVVFVSENWSSRKHFSRPLEWQGTGSKTPPSSQLDRVWSVLKANPKLMWDQGGVLVLKVGCFLATSSQIWGLSWVELVDEVHSRWFES